MASRSFEVKGYEVNLGNKLILTAQSAAVPCQALIQCRGGNNESFDIFVVSDSQNRPNTSEITAQRVVGRMFIPADQFAWYLDLLRNEKVSAHVDDSTPLLNRLTCGAPVGWGHME